MYPLGRIRDFWCGHFFQPLFKMRWWVSSYTPTREGKPLPCLPVSPLREFCSVRGLKLVNSVWKLAKIVPFQLDPIAEPYGRSLTHSLIKSPSFVRRWGPLDGTTRVLTPRTTSALYCLTQVKHHLSQTCYSFDCWSSKNTSQPHWPPDLARSATRILIPRTTHAFGHEVQRES